MNPQNNQVDSDVPPIDTEGEHLQINKKDIRPIADLRHEHIYERDGSEDTEEWYSVKCTVDGCIQGRLIRKFSPAGK